MKQDTGTVQPSSPHLPEFLNPDETDGPDKALHQGDVLEWLNPTPPWKELGVVLTADCDIDKRKHGGILSYAPILTFESYIQTILVPGRFEKNREKWKNKVLLLIHQFQRLQGTGLLTAEALNDWLKENQPAAITAALKAEGSPADALTKYLQAYNKSCRPETLTIAEQMEVLATFSGSEPEFSSNDIRDRGQDISSAVKSLPGDALFLTAVGPQRSRGYIVYLRLIREIPDTQIALRVPDMRKKPPPTARRIARIRSPYVYRITQMLAEVFSNIGLPSEYETHRDSTAIRVMEAALAEHQA